MTTRSFREPGAQPPAKPPSFPMKPTPNWPPRRKPKPKTEDCA